MTADATDTTDTVRVTAKVTNTGARAGDEVAQLYVAREQLRPIDPMRQLKGMQRVTLKPGESKTVKFDLTPKAFALVDEKGALRLDPGAFTISVGGRQPGADSLAQAMRTGLVSQKIEIGGATRYLAKDRPFPSHPK